MPRPRKIKQGKFTQKEWEAARELKKLFHPKSSGSAHHIPTLFKESCKESGISLEKGFVPFIGRLYLATKEKEEKKRTTGSTTDGYANKVWTLVKGIKSEQSTENGELMRCIQSYSASIQKVTLPPPSKEILCRILQAIECPITYISCFLGLCCGLRPRDTSRLKRKLFTWETRADGKGVYRYYVLLMKNRRKISDTIPSPDIPYDFSTPPTRRFLQYMKERKQHCVNDDPECLVIPAESYSYNRVWSQVHQTCRKLKIGDVQPMDFRRRYINEVIEGSPQEVWSRFTLHKNHLMVEAHYQAWKSLKEQN